MRFKKVIVPKYLFRDELGEFIFHDIAVLVDAASTITAETFSQEQDEYSILSSEIERMGREAGQRFFNDTYKKVLRGDQELTPSQFNGIRLFLNVNGTELANLLNLDKSSVSRMMSGKQEIQRNTQLLLMEKLKNELETPGITRAILKELENGDPTETVHLDFSAMAISEWLIRRFLELEDCITNLKLQKMLYYCQGVAAGKYNCRLIKEDFLAWEHGPVIESIYHSYKSCGSSALPINQSADITMIQENELALRVLTDAMNLYGKFGAWVLRNKTHCETPWIETPQGSVIEFEKMKSFFKETLV